MNKSIYLAAFAALALTACSNDSNEVFDGSAAERLEQYKKEYTDVLTSGGGLWTMEYFSNEEEPGYLFVMKFDKNGSVTISANHKWIGNTYREETSLWKMIADNGPVISFNSYNPIFHIFSDPANITGPEAPKGDSNEDINETGFGHEGDYEFQVLEVSDDQNSIRLLGKKRYYHIYLRRLDPSTDVKAFMDEYKEMESTLFSKEMSKLILTDSDGERYIVNGGSTGVLSIYPEAGDAVDQLSTSSFIVTPTGIRFINPINIENAAGEEKTVNEFILTANKSLVNVDDENCVLNAGTFVEYTYNNLRNWKIDTKTFDGTLKTSLDEFNEELKTLYSYKSAGVNEISFDYDAAKKSYLMRVYIRMSSKGYETDKYILTFSEADGGTRLSIGEPYDSTAELAYNAYPKMREFFSLLTSAVATTVANSDCGPKYVTMSVAGGSFKLTAQ